MKKTEHSKLGVQAQHSITPGEQGKEKEGCLLYSLDVATQRMGKQAARHRLFYGIRMVSTS